MPKFDYKAAKADGYTDAQIKQFLDSQKAKGVDVWIDKADVQPAPPPPSKPLDPLAYIPAIPGSPWGGLTMARSVDATPNALGLAGGVVAGIGGAAYGGALGETYREAMRQMPLDARAIASQGANQALYQGIGTALGAGTALASGTIGPAARLAERAAENPLLRRTIGSGLPLAGMYRGGIPGAIAGAAVPLAGKAVLGAAKSPKTAAFLGSMAFRTFMRHSPQAGMAIIQLLSEPADATQTR